jgi:hypothetical protein
MVVLGLLIVLSCFGSVHKSTYVVRDSVKRDRKVCQKRPRTQANAAKVYLRTKTVEEDRTRGTEFQ